MVWTADHELGGRSTSVPRPFARAACMVGVRVRAALLRTHSSGPAFGGNGHGLGAPRPSRGRVHPNTQLVADGRARSKEY